MSYALQLLSALFAGGLLGLAFFWGLWLTIAGFDRAQRPVRKLIASLLLRFGMVFAGFYLLARLGSWEHVVAGVIGFVLSRFLVIRRVRTRPPDAVGQESDA